MIALTDMIQHIQQSVRQFMGGVLLKGGADIGQLCGQCQCVNSGIYVDECDFYQTPGVSFYGFRVMSRSGTASIFSEERLITQDGSAAHEASIFVVELGGAVHG